MPVFDAYEATSLYKDMPDIKGSPILKMITLRTCFIAFIAMIAIAVPKFDLFINLVGAFSCTAIAFILPIQMYESLFKKEIGMCRKFLHRIILLIGMCIGAISVMISIRELMKAYI